LIVKINGNRGAQQEISVSTKVLKDVVPFQQEIPECDVKNNPTGHPESDKKIRPLVLLEIRLRLLLKISDSLRLRLHNRGHKH